MTAALEGGEWSVACPGRTLPPGKTRYPFYRRLGGPQGRPGEAENLVHTRIRSWTVQPVVSRYTDWATRPTGKLKYTEQNLSQCRFVQRACHRNWRGTGDTTLQMLWTKESLSRKTGVNECSYKLETCLIVCPRFMTARGKVTLARRPWNWDKCPVTVTLATSYQQWRLDNFSLTADVQRRWANKYQSEHVPASLVQFAINIPIGLLQRLFSDAVSTAEVTDR